MDNGHGYPPDFLFRIDGRKDHAVTQHQVVDELRRRYPSDWPAIWSLLWSHREACMVSVLRSLDAALSQPKVTQQGLRRSMLAALEAIAERGPEAIGPRQRSSG